MGIVEDIRAMGRGLASKARAFWPGEHASSERGRRATPESSLNYQYRMLWVDPDQRHAILDIRKMDRSDGRVKRIHSRVARDIVKGGLVFSQVSENADLRREWEDFSRRLQLSRPEKLRSDARGLVMEGAACLQWVLDEGMNVVSGIRMPSETIVPQVDAAGRFKDPRRAFVQFDPVEGRELAAFALYQMTMARFDPESFDDAGALGRPFLDASRDVWKKLRMTEQDLVIRRRQRAPLRMAHVLEGATDADIEKYRAANERDQREITTDYYLNKKGGVSAIQGDANLDQNGDVIHLLDTFFSGTPVPKGLMGYTEDMARDILEDLKRDYYEEVDSLQDTLAWGYDQGFRLHLLLKGMNPDAEEYWVGFAERRTETPNQTTDRMLKWQAMGMPPEMIWEEMGLNPQDVRRRKEESAKHTSPYPDPTRIGPAGAQSPTAPTVKVTPGNAPKGESATSTTHSNRLSEHWPEPADDPAAPLADAVKVLGEIGMALAQRQPHSQEPTVMPAPQIHVSLPKIDIPPIQVNVPDVNLNIPAPVVHVAAPVVHVAAPDVHVAAPDVTVAAPVVHVAAPEVSVEAVLPAPNVTVVNSPRRIETTVVRDKQTGEMTGSVAVETLLKE